jgi:LPS sulfotransferase NodH
VHSQKLDDFFNHSEQFENLTSHETDVSLKLPDTYYICYTARSGSHYLAQLIASDERMDYVGENINFDTVIDWSKEKNFKSFKEYYYWLSDCYKGSFNKFGCKVDPGQLIYLMNEGLLNQLEMKPKFIHLVRKDIIAQAVSLFIARKTQRWTSSQVGNNAQIEFNFLELTNIAHSICTQNSIFNLLFRLLGVEPLIVVYEDLINNPQSSLDLISAFIDVPNLSYNENKINIQKQADDLNRAFIEEFQSNFLLSF